MFFFITGYACVMVDGIRIQLVYRGPSEVPQKFVLPRNECDGKSCHQQYFIETLFIGEQIHRG